MRIYRPSPRFAFANGEIGTDDFSAFMNELPKIDLVYNAPPNPKMMSFWHDYEPISYTYKTFFDALCDLYKLADPEELYIEVGENRDMVIEFIENWGKHTYITVKDILYSAPADGKTKRMARCRNATEIVIATTGYTDFDFFGKYSYDLLDGVLQRWGKHLNIFDPCIGKGLALRKAIEHKHSCYGIEFNQKRLDCTLEYLKNSGVK